VITLKELNLPGGRQVQPFSGLLDVNLIITAKRYNQHFLI
jgi:hypothetical protein